MLNKNTSVENENRETYLDVQGINVYNTKHQNSVRKMINELCRLMKTNYFLNQNVSK